MPSAEHDGDDDRADTLDLVERARDGDRDALDRLVARFRPRLEAFIHVRLGSRLRGCVEPSDVFQETWRRATGSIESFRWRGKGSFFRWISTVAENVIRNWARYYLHSTKRNPAADVPLGVPGDDDSSHDGVPGAAIVAPDPTPSESLRRKERLDRLAAALRRLPPAYRQVIVLVRLRGLSRREVARRMGRSEDAISMLLVRALRKLRTHFGDTESFSLPDDARLDDLDIERDGGDGAGGGRGDAAADH